MKRVALFGSPVAHSVSPAMHNACFAALRMPWHYEAIDVSPADLSGQVEALRGVDWAGANITVPHKVTTAGLVDELSDSARAVGAVNTIVNTDGTLVGHNTDIDGFIADLNAHGVEVAERPAVILGAGGAARALAHALESLQAAVRVVCRNPEAGRGLLPTRSGSGGVFAWSTDGFRAAAKGAALIVNATPIGMSPDDRSSPWPLDLPLPRGAFVYDLVFNPAETSLVGAARRSRLNACGGLGMLVEQGARSFELWSGTPPPRSVMTAAAMAALEKQDATVSYRG